jgi:hypothetical protein
MYKHITYGRLRDIMVSLGFQEERRSYGVALKYPKSDLIFLFRPYQETDEVKPAEVYNIRELLDARNLLDADAFDGLLLKAPA